MDIDTLQSLDSKGIARKHLGSKLHVGDVGKLFLMSANVIVYYFVLMNYILCCV